MWVTYLTNGGLVKLEHMGVIQPTKEGSSGSVKSALHMTSFKQLIKNNWRYVRLHAARNLTPHVSTILITKSEIYNPTTTTALIMHAATDVRPHGNTALIMQSEKQD